MDRVTFADLIETFKASAICTALVPTEDSLYRNFCRRYSIAFHTPLHLVQKLEPEFVILNVFEHEMDSMNVDENLEDLLEMIYQIEDPSYDSKAEEDLSEFAALAQIEEDERIKHGRKIGYKMPIEKPHPKEELPEPPAQGSVNLAYLQDNENER